MPKFTYISRDSRGQRVTAVADASSRQDLLAQLKGRGLTVVEVRELTNGHVATDRSRGKVAFSRLSWTRVNTSELAVFWRELATMIAAGLPVVDALESIGQELEHVRLRRVLQDVTSSMWEGFSFSEALKKHPKAFSPMVVALIASAEESGNLAEVSEQLAMYLENRDRIIRKVRAALTYPIFLCCFFVLVMIVATYWIIPKFRDIYSGFGAKLPWLTNMVFDFNAFVLKYTAWIAAATVLLIVATIGWAKTKSGRTTLDRISLKLPIFGKLLQRAAVSRFCRSLGILLAGGIPINRAMEMAQHTTGNSVLGKAIRDAREDILKGGKIAQSFKTQKIFPQMAIRLVATGEESGNLSDLLAKVADFYEQRVDAALTTINALIEPVMIVMVGMFVLVFVLSMYLPIFSLAATMHG